MKIVAALLSTCICLYSCGQNNQLKVDMNKVNESVKTLSIESELGNNIIKDELSKHSDSLKNEIQKLSNIISDFNRFVNVLNDGLIAKAGGIDSKGRPVLYKDKNVTNQYFLADKKGEALKNSIEKTREQILSFIDKEHVEELSQSIPLTIQETYITDSGKNWEDIKFKDMPVAAVLPILKKCIADANTSERVILDYWRLKYK